MFSDEPYVSSALPVNVCWVCALCVSSFCKGSWGYPCRLLGAQPAVHLWPTLQHPALEKHVSNNTLVETYYRAGFQCSRQNTSSSSGPVLSRSSLSPGSNPSSCPLPQCTLDQCAHSRWRAKKTVSPPAMSRLITPPFSFSHSPLSLSSLSFYPPTLFFPHSQDLERQTLICLYF